MSSSSLNRNGNSVPSLGDAANAISAAKEIGPTLVNGSKRSENGQEKTNGQTVNGQTQVKKRHKRRTKQRPAARVPAPVANKTDEPRPLLAVFCWEGPDTPVGRSALHTLAALARRKTFVHLFVPSSFGLDGPNVREHVVGDNCSDDFFGRVGDFTSRAANAFLNEFPGGSPHVTLLGYEWSGAGPLGLLRGLKNNRTIFSLTSMERQRSDMTAEISKRIDELEQNTLRESQVILSQEPAAAEAAKFWTPDCADRLVGARRPFPVENFASLLDPGEVKARYQVGPVDPTILFIGDISDPYGPDLLVKAMPAVLKNHPQARLILVGDGSTFWTLRVWSRYLLLDHAIRFPGSVVGQAMQELIAASDMVVLPSRKATPWWPIQAAWAAQKPVVATHLAAPGLLEHERDSLLVYPVEQSIVWGVERILFDNELAAALAQKGRVKLEERFGWNNVAEQIEELMGVPVRG